jgi:hypothetical protein
MAVSDIVLTAQILEDYDEASANYKWIRDNFVTLRKKHPDEFIAVMNREVVYHTKKYSGLLKYLYANRARPGLVPSQTYPADRILLR